MRGHLGARTPQGSPRNRSNGPRLACMRRQIPKLDVAGSTPVARSLSIIVSARSRSDGGIAGAHDTGLGAATEKSRHSPGTPFRAWAPLSTNCNPDPATRCCASCRRQASRAPRSWCSRANMKSAAQGEQTRGERGGRAGACWCRSARPSCTRAYRRRPAGSRSQAPQIRPRIFPRPAPRRLLGAVDSGGLTGGQARSAGADDRDGSSGHDPLPVLRQRQPSRPTILRGVRREARCFLRLLRGAE